MIKIIKTYRSLSSEQKQILKEKVVDLNRPADELLALLKPLAGCDAIADKARTPLGCTMAFGIVLLIAGVIAIVNMELGTGPLLAYIAVMAVLLALDIFLFAWSKHVDLSNNVRQFVIPVLTVLREDMGREPVHVKLDLRPPTIKEKKTGEEPPYESGPYYKIVATTYLDPWMTAEATLRDGTRLWWKITDHIRELRKTKRNARGKIKMKTKHKKRTDIEVEVALRNKFYALDKKSGGELESDDKRTSVRIERTIKTPTLDPIEPRALLDAVTGVYANARMVKKEA